MMPAPESNSEPQSFPICLSSPKPLILKEVLQLRDGLGLSRKPFPGLIAQKVHPKLQFGGWVVPSLN